MTYRARTLLAAIGLAVLAALFVGFYVSNYKRSVQHSPLKVNPDKGVAATRIVLRNLRVLRAPGGLTDKNKSLTSTGPGNSSYSVLVAVTDTQVQKLFYVMKNSDWTLELRPIVKASDSPE